MTGYDLRAGSNGAGPRAAQPSSKRGEQVGHGGASGALRRRMRGTASIRTASRLHDCFVSSAVRCSVGANVTVFVQAQWRCERQRTRPLLVCMKEGGMSSAVCGCESDWGG